MIKITNISIIRFLIYHAIVLGCVLLVVSCQKDDTGLFNDGGKVHFKIEINNQNPNTRTIQNSDGSGQFISGDKITVHTHPEQNISGSKFYSLEFDGNTWIPELSWKELGGDKTIFTAFYPEVNTDAAIYNHKIEPDQSQEGNYEKSDLLAATTTGEKGGPVVLTFNHIMSRLIIRLSSNGLFSPSELADAEVSVFSLTEIPVTLSDGSLSPAAGTLQPIKARNTGNGTFCAIVPPQSVTDFRNSTWLHIKINDKEINYPAPEKLDGKTFDRLNSGQEVTVNLTLNEKPDPGKWANKTFWTYGVNVKEPYNDPIQWEEGCGWYDCDKVDPSGKEDNSDGYMCWAASASNMIHSWMEQNRDKIPAGYNGPSPIYTDNKKSDIFQFFKDHCTHRGSDVLRGLNYFFNGIFYLTMYDTDEPDLTNAGFFFDELGFRSLGYLEKSFISKDIFNNLIKNAFDNKKAVAFGFYMNPYGNHAVNLWGAEFDENGDVKYIYMVDNNGQANSMYKKEIRYLPITAGDENSPLGVYFPGSTGTIFNNRIIMLTTLSLDL